MPATQSLQFATLLAERKIPYEMHIFAYGDHGFSTGSRHVANPKTRKTRKPQCGRAWHWAS